MTPYRRFLLDTVAVRMPRLVAPFTSGLLWRGATTGRTLYLTFDDGPDPRDAHAGGTPALLDQLAQRGIPATFFLIGQYAKRHPDLVRAIVEAGHAVGNHSYTHPNFWKLPAAAVRDELDATTKLLEDLTGQPVRYHRPPYGRITRDVRAWCAAHGQRVIMWDVMPGDFFETATVEGLARHILRFARPGSLLVLHEGGRARQKMPAVLNAVLPRLDAAGWAFADLRPFQVPA